MVALVDIGGFRVDAERDRAAGAGEVVVPGVFGDEAADAGLAEVVDPLTEFLDGVVELVGVVVEDGASC